MNQSLRNALRKLVLASRAQLEQAVAERLEGRFTIYERAGKLVADRKARTDHLDDAELRLRHDVLDHLASLAASGMAAVEAYRQLIREVAFTWLNRFVAFKMLEARKLIRETIARWDDSNGFKHWLVENGIDVIPIGDERAALYHRFLLARCGDLAGEIRVLFDPDNLPSRLAPPAATLRQLADSLNQPELADAWQPGNEETLGWVYQDFNEADLEPLRGLSTFKVPASLIPAKTQKFTLRWVIRYLVHNTLGRLWLEMHPDSTLAQQLDYLASEAAPTSAARPRSVRDIRLLDPACGTMHFGLVAFDLFVAMYREECQRAGQPGWPDKPPVASDEEIPAAILAHNLHGIDIDPRAVQISALALYLKAKPLAPKQTLTQSRLACANVHMLNGERLGAFLKAAGLDRRPIYGRILQALQQELKLSEHLGALLPLEQRIRELIDAERRRYEKEGRQPDLFGWSREQFETEAGRREFWETLEKQIGQALDAFARDEAARGQNQTYFAQETVQGLRLLELLGQSYDVVVTNPPFLDTRDMNDELKKLVDTQYPDCKRNLYAPFVLRCLDLVTAGGRIGVITGQTFMFIKTFEKFRKLLLDQCVIESLQQYDYGLFDGVRVDTAAYVLRKEPDARRREASVGTYFRLVKEPDAESKRRAFERACPLSLVPGPLSLVPGPLSLVRSSQPRPDDQEQMTNDKGQMTNCIFRYSQKDFAAIPGSPWVYWITPGLRRLFETLPKLGDVATPRQGLATADNFRFLRYWWEVGTPRIAFGCRNAQEAQRSGKRWFPYMKGGSFRRWYGNQEYVVNWENDGEEIRNLESANGRIASRPQNTDYYFRRGVTWSRTTSKGISVRELPHGFIIDCEAPASFGTNNLQLLAVLNSSVANAQLRVLNPTIHFQVGDLARLPIPEHSSPALEQLVEQAIALAKADSAEDETTWDFVAPPRWPDGLQLVAQRHARLAEIERQIDEEVYRLYGISAEDRAAIEAELSDSSFVSGQLSVDDGETVEDEQLTTDQGPTIKDQGPRTTDQLAQAWISFAVSKVFDSGPFWERDKLAEQVLRQLEKLLGESAAAEVVTTACGTKGSLSERLTDDLGEAFFKRHVQQYRKRPIYWLLQSARKNYGVWLHARQYDRDTLFKVLLNEVEPKIRLVESQMSSVRSQLQKTKDQGPRTKDQKRLAKEIERQEEFLSELRDFEEKLRRAANLHLDPDINDGVALNIAPLHELVPWKEAKKYWEELLAGKYEWSSIGKQLRKRGQVR
jgi:hypothetical protein